MALAIDRRERAAYNLKRYDRDPVTRQAPPELKALHPLGVAPVITDGEVVLAESGRSWIICDRCGAGSLATGPDRPEFADYLYWFHFANGSQALDLCDDRCLGLGPARFS